MPQVNAQIVKKLNSYPADVREVAVEAVRLAESFSESAIVERMDAAVRRLAKHRPGASE